MKTALLTSRIKEESLSFKDYPSLEDPESPKVVAFGSFEVNEKKILWVELEGPEHYPRTQREWLQYKLTGKWWPAEEGGGIIVVNFEDLKDKKLSEELRKIAEEKLKPFKRELLEHDYICVDLIISQLNPIKPDEEYFWKSIKPKWAFTDKERKEMIRDSRFQEAMKMLRWIPYAGALCFPLGKIGGCYIYVRIRGAEPPARWDNLGEVEFSEEKKDNKGKERPKKRTLKDFFGGGREWRRD